jgi:hypothetical protein
MSDNLINRLQNLTVQEKASLYRQIARETHKDLDGRIWNELASMYEALAGVRTSTSHVRLTPIAELDIPESWT